MFVDSGDISKLFFSRCDQYELDIALKYHFNYLYSQNNSKYDLNRRVVTHTAVTH